MGDMFSSVRNMAGGLLGETDSQYQAKQANQRAQQGYNDGSGYRNQAATGLDTLVNLGTTGAANNAGYTPLTNYGQANLNTAQSQLPGAIANYGALTGINQSDPYQLTDPERTQLSAGLDALNSRQNTAISNYQAEMGRRGITDPADMAAGEAALRANFGNMATQHQAAFMDNIAQQRKQAQQQQIQNLSSLGTTGASIYGQGVNGNLQTLENGTNGLANLGAQASGQAVQQSQLAAANTAANNSALSSLLQLAGYGIGGGFGGTGLAVDPQGMYGAAQRGADPSDFTGLTNEDFYTNAGMQA